MNLVKFDVNNTSISTVQKDGLAIEEIHKKIYNMDELHIDLIGSKISEKILANLGSVSKARVAQKVAQNCELDCPIEITSIESGEENFLFDSDVSKFLLTILWAIKGVLADAFSKPDIFLDSGLYFHLSNNHPKGILSDTAKKIKIDITSEDVPSKYFIYLRLDKKISQEKSDLVFSIIETSQDVVFSTTLFTIKELEKEFVSKFSQ